MSFLFGLQAVAAALGLGPGLLAVAWANVRADGVPDVRARHEALPTAATKVAVNCWVRAFPGADAL